MNIYRIITIKLKSPINHQPSPPTHYPRLGIQKLIVRRKGEPAVPSPRPPNPLNVGLPIGWYGLVVDDGADRRTFELVDGTGTPSNESREM